MGDCQKTFDHLYEFLNKNDLIPEVQGEIEKHLALCRNCFDRVEFERLLLQRLRDSSPAEAPPSLTAKVRDIVGRF